MTGSRRPRRVRATSTCRTAVRWSASRAGWQRGQSVAARRRAARRQRSDVPSLPVGLDRLGGADPHLVVRPGSTGTWPERAEEVRAGHGQRVTALMERLGDARGSRPAPSRRRGARPSRPRRRRERPLAKAATTSRRRAPPCGVSESTPATQCSSRTGCARSGHPARRRSGPPASRARRRQSTRGLGVVEARRLRRDGWRPRRRGGPGPSGHPSRAPGGGCRRRGTRTRRAPSGGIAGDLGGTPRRRRRPADAQCRARRCAS